MNDVTSAPRGATPASTLVVSGIVFGISVLVTVAFGYYMVSDPSRLAEAWQWVRGLPLPIQIVMWLLLLPWMIALWVWSMPWALGLRIATVSALLIGSNIVLFPWKR